MKKVSIIFGSTTGNTERVANIIKDNLSGCEVTLSNVSNADDALISSADLVVFGSSTWGYGDIQDDFLPYYEKLSSDLITGKDIAVFGCGDSEAFEDVFCEAVNLITSKVQQLGATVVCEGLKVDGDVEDNLDEIEAFAKALV